MSLRVVAAALTITLIALLSLSGCAVTVGYEDGPADEPPVGQRVMVQSTAAAVQTPTPPAPKEPEPPKEEKKPEPNKAAASGAGFNLTVKSAGCNPVSFFDDAKDWNVDPALSKEKTETHGHITVCNGCLN